MFVRVARVLYSFDLDDKLNKSNINATHSVYLLLSCAVIRLDDSVCLILLNLVPCSGTGASLPELLSADTGGTGTI